LCPIDIKITTTLQEDFCNYNNPCACFFDSDLRINDIGRGRIDYLDSVLIVKVHKNAKWYFPFLTRSETIATHRIKFGSAMKFINDKLQ